MKLTLKSFSSHLLIALILLSAGSLCAAQSPFPQYVGHVNDFADVIDRQTEQQLETILNNFEGLTGTQIAAVTVQSLNGRPVEEYANELYRAWGIGAKTGPNKDKGALLLVALGDRKTRLEVGYGLEGDLPDGLAGEIIRRMRSFLQKGDYSQAMNVGVRTLVDTLAQKWQISVEGTEDRKFAYPGSASSDHTGSAARPLIFILFFIVFAIVMMVVARSKRRGGGPGGGIGGAASNLWWLYPIIFNRSGGSFGGGSWGSGGGGWGSSGGGSSGGSNWGGFGGGSSGGGGASDSW